jgi:hypothetical protein
MTQLDKPRLPARLARTVATAAGQELLEACLCQAYLSILGGEGAALTLAYNKLERVTLCATDDIAARLEDLPGRARRRSRPRGRQLRCDGCGGSA